MHFFLKLIITKNGTIKLLSANDQKKIRIVNLNDFGLISKLSLFKNSVEKLQILNKCISNSLYDLKNYFLTKKNLEKKLTLLITFFPFSASSLASSYKKKFVQKLDRVFPALFAINKTRLYLKLFLWYVIHFAIKSNNFVKKFFILLNFVFIY